MKTPYTIRRLVWKLMASNNDHEEWMAETVFGDYSVAGGEQTSGVWFYYPENSDTDQLANRVNRVDGKAKAQAHYEAAMAEGLVEHVCELLYEDELWFTSCPENTRAYGHKPDRLRLGSYCGHCGGKIKEDSDDN